VENKAADEIERLKEHVAEWKERAESQLETTKIRTKEIERLKAELDEAREAAAEFAGYRPPMADDLRNWLRRFPWLKNMLDTPADHPSE
jgi:DNA repair exonuclease SbcCD ATPase subunit